MKGPPPKLHTFQGRTLSLRGWAKVSGVSFWNLKNRLRYGYTLEQAFTLPLHRRRKRKQLVVVSAQQVLRSWGVVSFE